MFAGNPGIEEKQTSRIFQTGFRMQKEKQFAPCHKTAAETLTRMQTGALLHFGGKLVAGEGKAMPVAGIRRTHP
jgi:hypothetical protein